MNRLANFVVLIPIVAMLGGCAASRPDDTAANESRLAYGENEIRITWNPLAYEIRRGGQTLIAKTPIALEVGGRQLAGGRPALTRSDFRVDSPSPVYKKSAVRLRGRELEADFGDWAVRFVICDDGVAYRFETKFPGKVTVNAERADFTLAPETCCFVNYNHSNFRGDALQNSWESRNVTELASEMVTTNRIAYLPLVFQTTNGTAVCVSESDLRDYPGWNLKVDKSAARVRLVGEFAKFPQVEKFFEWGKPPKFSDDQRLRTRKVTAREDYLVKTTGTRTFPWRCFMIGSDASKLVANDLVWALAAPNRLTDSSWVRPGKVAWEWWNAWDNLGRDAGCTTKGYERFIDFASRHGVEYVIFDEGWSEKLNIWKYDPKVDVPHLVEYARQRGVGIILWMAWSQVVGDEERVAAHFARLGVKGFKVDFMDRDDAACVNFLWKFAAACAKERMLIDYHGMYKPTGMERTYPNVLNFEGIHGLEQMKWFSNGYDMMASDVKSYFVRMSAGPMDYTPGAMDNYPIGKYAGNNVNPGSVGTRCRQMAMMALYFAPLQMLCDSPTKYERNLECFEFMAATPVVWDDTVGLAGSPDAMCACARRRGEVWYAAGMTNADGRDYRVDTSFLGSGEWRVEIFRDADDADTAPTKYLHESGRRVRAGDPIAVRMAKGGGFIMRFTK